MILSKTKRLIQFPEVSTIWNYLRLDKEIKIKRIIICAETGKKYLVKNIEVTVKITDNYRAVSTCWKHNKRGQVLIWPGEVFDNLLDYEIARL